MYTNGTKVVQDEQEKKSYTTKSGYTIRFRTIAPSLIAKVQQSIDEAKKPTYVEERVGGKNEDGTPLMIAVNVEHDESTLETEEEKQAWADYLRKRDEVDKLRKERIMQLFYLRGIDVDLPNNDEWLEDQRYLGVKDLPDGSDTRGTKLHFLDTEVLASPEDIMEVITAIITLSGVEQEAIEEARAMFRRTISGQGTGEVVAESGPNEPDADGMEVQHDIQGRGHSVQMASDSFDFLESTARRTGVDDSLLQHGE